MEISGKVIKALPLQSGTGKNGVWKKQDYILEIPSEKFPKKVCITLWGENIDKFNIREGNSITAGIDIESREYNGKWYTDVKAWKVNMNDSTSTEQFSNVVSNDAAFFPPLVERARSSRIRGHVAEDFHCRINSARTPVPLGQLEGEAPV